jgi:hypothetical protein
MAKSKGAPQRARSTSRKLYSLPPEEHELGAGNVVDDVLGNVLRAFGPRIADAIVAKLSAPRPAPAADLEGRLLRMETQVGYLSTTVRALADRIVVLESERKH